MASNENRKVVLHAGGDSFCDNEVVTSHYTVLNFVPMNLYEQFSKPANVYFFILAILQMIPRVSTTGGWPTIAVPLLCVLTMNAIKDAIEDWRRHKSDKMENERSVLCLSSLGNSTTPGEMSWRDVRVGSLVIIKQNEYVPADFVILNSAHAEGHVYIETANLDGETNLKTKQANDKVRAYTVGVSDYEAATQKARQLKGQIECDGPNEFLYTFVGTLTANTEMGEEKIPLNEENVVLRGCKIKNVAWTLGIVVYTGKQTKIMMNSKTLKERKLSHLERDIGRQTLQIFSMQTVLCVVGGIFSVIFETTPTNLANKQYLNLVKETGEPDPGWLVFIIRFFNFVILFSNFIPISLLVSMSVVKLIQIYFFYADADMSYQGMQCMPRTSDLNEELGQVEYIFSDKTGTLTCNIMDFRKFCVLGVTYGQGLTEIKKNLMMKMGKIVEEPASPKGGPRTPHVDLYDQTLEELLTQRSGKQYEAVRVFLMHLAINHEVVTDFDDNGNMLYSASSPDEEALCYGAKHFGYAFQGRDSNGLTVAMADQEAPVRVRILAILKFNSTRKRSSVIAQFDDIQNGVPISRQMLLTKGADSVIMERLAPHLKNSPETKNTLDILKEYAEDGLRTLVLAGRELSSEELEEWMAKYTEASISTEKRAEKLDEVAEDIEKDLEFHGITGIEDRLQDDVGNTIVKMAQAGIKVWMLTGDKTETAINIGVATGMLDVEEVPGERPMFCSPDMEVDGVFNPERVVERLKKVATEAESRTVDNMFEGMLIDGVCLEVALSPENQQYFVEISRKTKAVVCCRVSPKQKGQVVLLIKVEERAITLAIGDGANDCNMIQSADVGIGIRGLEGLQAFNVCDYGISQFRFLSPLVLAHGRWCYRRVAILVNLTFYKNFVVVLPQYMLGFVSWFSGQKLYNDLMYQAYNVVHSMAPVMMFGIMDQDVSKKAALEHPELYSLGPKKSYMNAKSTCSWWATGLWHAICVFMIPYFTMANTNITDSDGKANDIWLMGTMVYFCVVLVVNFRIIIESGYLSWFSVLGIVFSLFFWFLEEACLTGEVSGTVWVSQKHGLLFRMLGAPMSWIIIVVTVSVALSVDLHCKGIQCSYFPNVLHRVQAKVLAQKIKAKGG